MLRRQKNRSHIERAKKAIQEDLKKFFPTDQHLINLHINPANATAFLKIEHLIKGTITLDKEESGWSFQHMRGSTVECTNLAHVKKCIVEIFSN